MRVDTTTNTVTYLPLSDEAPTGAGPEQTIEYAHLIVASGSRAHGGWPFKSAEPLSALKQSLQQSQKKIAEAQTIVLAGGGPTSIETAGEIATFYPEKKVTLVSASETLLPTAPSKVGNTAEKTLKQVGIEVRKGVKVVDHRDGEVVLENGEKLPADLYIPSAGLIPNSEFLPRELVAENGGIKVNENLRTGVENVWALGDVLDVQDKRLAIVGGMVPVVSANVLTTIKNAQTTLKTYDESKLMKMMFVPIGSKFGKGTGHVGGYKVPGLIVWAGKSRDMMVGGVKNIADGKMMPGFVKV